MSVYTFLGMVLGTWVLLATLGNERQRELVRVRRQMPRRNPEPLEAAVPPPGPVPAKAPVPGKARVAGNAPVPGMKK